MNKGEVDVSQKLYYTYALNGTIDSSGKIDLTGVSIVPIHDEAGNEVGYGTTRITKDGQIEIDSLVRLSEELSAVKRISLSVEGRLKLALPNMNETKK